MAAYGEGQHVTPRHPLERRGVRGAGRGLPQHRFHGRAAAGGPAGCRRRPGLPPARSLLDLVVHHVLLCIAFVALWTAPTSTGRATRRRRRWPAWRSPQPDALGDLSRVALSSVARIACSVAPVDVHRSGLLGHAASPVALFTIGAWLGALAVPRGGRRPGPDAVRRLRPGGRDQAGSCIPLLVLGWSEPPRARLGCASRLPSR